MSRKEETYTIEWNDAEYTYTGDTVPSIALTDWALEMLQFDELDLQDLCWTTILVTNSRGEAGTYQLEPVRKFHAIKM